MYLQFLGHVLEAVQHLIRWRKGRGQGDVSDDAIQAIHITDQQTRALIVTGCEKKQEHTIRHDQHLRASAERKGDEKKFYF